MKCGGAADRGSAAFLMNFHESKLIKRLPYAIIN